MNSENLIAKDDSWILAALCEYSIRNNFDMSSVAVKRLKGDRVEIRLNSRELSPEDSTGREVGKIQSYIYCHAALSGQAYADVSLFPDSFILDLLYLYPLESFSSGGYKSLISKIISQIQLNSIIRFNEFPVLFSDLEENLARRATDLLIVRLRERISVRFSDSTLYIEACGYLQIQEILKLFGECCVEAKISEGLVERNSALKGPVERIKRREDQKVERFDVPLYYITYEIDNEILTEYYLKSSDRKIIIREEKREFNQERFDELQKLLISGELFTREAKNILRAYPNFVPSTGIHSFEPPSHSG
ncbi:MAG: hypothetical protein Solivirus2_62 [Solivirus sp.]|uniref:Uncharacterized protein n=1 Tax=Solivirus sp. TaxID=2487772 RepID=A0A3G5AI60_9VIRU|nr:MAG: hypothetical protein Solivirus2_62 [Solivirus sp.]